MPNPDPYLRPGLTPPTDVELYASESAGGTTTNQSAFATAVGVADVGRTVALGRVFAVTATGTASESHQFISGTGTTTPVAVEVTATGVAEMSYTITRAFQFTPSAGGPGGRYREARDHCRYAAATARGRAHVATSVDHAGRRRNEDELVALGSF